MHGIILKNSIETFGFKDGVKFWFRFNISYPIRDFVWTYVTRHHMCTEHGYYVPCGENCTALKLTNRKDKINYQRERRKQIDVDSKTIICGPNGECAYCSEEPGTELIDDPNWDTLKKWKVCKTCKEILDLQHDLHFYSIPLMSDKHPEKCSEINEKLSDISKKTGKTIINCSITRNNDGGHSVEYTTFDGKIDTHEN